MFFIQFDVVILDRDVVVAVLDRKRNIVEEVDLRRADESCDEYVLGMVEHFLRRTDLLDESVSHDNDPVTERHCFDLIVRDVDECGVDLLTKTDDLRTHLSAEFRIQVGERLVHQNDLRLSYNCTSDCNTLSLAAGKRLRESVKDFRDLQRAGGFLNFPVDFFLGQFSEFQGERHILVNSHMGIQGVVLEDHRDVPVTGSDDIGKDVTDIKFTVADLLKSGDHTQRGRFSASGRTDENDEFLVLDLKIEILNGDDSLIRDLEIRDKTFCRRCVFDPFLCLLAGTDLFIRDGVDLLDVLKGNTGHYSALTVPPPVSCLISYRHKGYETFSARLHNADPRATVPPSFLPPINGGAQY